jgi:hypothetical protein
MKPFTLAVCVTIIVAIIIGTCGCTSSPNEATPTPAASLAPDNLARALNDMYRENGYTVNAPITMTKLGDTITYHGVVTDPPQKKYPTKQDFTIVLVPDRASALDTYRSSVNTQKALGYLEDFNNSDVLWIGNLGTLNPSATVPHCDVKLREPWWGGLILSGESISNADLNNRYQVMTTEYTPVA